MLPRAGKPRLSFIEFQMPELVSKAPAGADSIHEIKYDGYRTELVLEGGKARAYTRRGDAAMTGPNAIRPSLRRSRRCQPSRPYWTARRWCSARLAVRTSR